MNNVYHRRANESIHLTGFLDVWGVTLGSVLLTECLCGVLSSAAGQLPLQRGDHGHECVPRLHRAPLHRLYPGLQGNSISLLKSQVGVRRRKEWWY